MGKKSRGTTFKNIILKSKRGKFFCGPKMCSRCGCVTGPVTRYRESNIGEVYLCPECKDRVREDSFGYADIWTLTYR